MADATPLLTVQKNNAAPAERPALATISRKMRGSKSATSIVYLALGPLIALQVQNVQAFTSISHDHCLSRMRQKLVSPSACENVEIPAATFTSSYAHSAVPGASEHFDESIPNDLQETTTTTASATSAEVSRRSALTTLTALALGGRALTRKPKPSSASSTASIAVTKSIQESAAAGAPLFSLAHPSRRRDWRRRRQ